MLTDRVVICISSIDWDFIWQGHQEIMSTLAAQGNRVLFVENTGVRAPGLRDLKRLRHRLFNWWKGTKGFKRVRENLFVYSPLILPFPYFRIACWLNRGLLFRAIQRWMHAVGGGRPLIWTFLPTPLVCDFIQALDPELTVYYCIDDLASSSPQARRIRKSEDRLVRKADLVFVTSEKLRERAAPLNPQVHFFPFGVDFETFERVRRGPDEIPTDLQKLPRPIIGYVGGVHQWVDQELLATVADRMPQASFVLVGPPQTDVSRLRRIRNIHLLSARPHAVLPNYIKGFDVGIIAYRLSEYTAHVYPTKLNEYLSMGIPVVATDLPEIRRFNADYGDVVAVGQDVEGFLGAIQRMLQPAPPEVIERRIAVAQQNSWSRRVAQMAQLIEEQLQAHQARELTWEASLRRLYRMTRRRVMRTIVGALAAYLLLFQSPFVWWVAEPLHVAEPARPADAIVVFAGGVGESGKAGGGYQERVKRAVDLYREGYAQHLIFSSGYTFVFQEAGVMKELAVANGVSPTSILLERRARNTYENVVFTADLLRQHQWRSVLLVSSPYHMRRALLTWRKNAPQITVIPTPVPQSQFYTHRRGANLEQIRGILHEYVALLVYWWRGWV